MLVFDCKVCRTSLSADEAQVGQLVRCPTCLTTLRVPAAPVAEGQRELAGVGSTAQSAGASAPPPQRRPNIPPQFRSGGGGKRYGFNCAYCSSRLEATEAM